MTRFSKFTALAVLAAFTATAVPAIAGSYGKSEAKPAAKSAGKSVGNVVQVARAAGSFNTLLAAVEAADLTGALSGVGKGPITVFAPTDAAFAKLPPGTVEGLLKNPEALRNVLLYHVADGKYLAADVVSRTTFTMLNGGTVNISNSPTEGVKVNDSKVTATDIAARNGVIHVIDTVLLPQ